MTQLEYVSLKTLKNRGASNLNLGNLRAEFGEEEIPVTRENLVRAVNVLWDDIGWWVSMAHPELYPEYKRRWHILWDRFLQESRAIDDDHRQRRKAINDEYFQQFKAIDELLTQQLNSLTDRRGPENKPVFEDHRQRCKAINDEYYQKRKVLTDNGTQENFSRSKTHRQNIAFLVADLLGLP